MNSLSIPAEPSALCNKCEKKPWYMKTREEKLKDGKYVRLELKIQRSSNPSDKGLLGGPRRR